MSPDPWLVIVVRAWRDEEGLRIRLTSSDGSRSAATTREQAAALVRDWLRDAIGDGTETPGA
jgi:hypothetical protein